MEAGPHFSGLHLVARFLPSSSSSIVSDLIKQSFVIGVSGGTASGKTTVCDMIIPQLHDHRVVLVNQGALHSRNKMMMEYITKGWNALNPEINDYFPTLRQSTRDS